MSTAPVQAVPALKDTKQPASAARTKRRRGVNREGLEAGRRSTRTILWVLLAASLILYGFPFLYLLLTSFKTPIDTIAVPRPFFPRNGRWIITPMH